MLGIRFCCRSTPRREGTKTFDTFPSPTQKGEDNEMSPVYTLWEGERYI